MSKQCNVAIAGATGEVGRALLAMLEEADLPIDRVYVLASENSLEETLMYKKRSLLVESLEEFDFSLAQFVVLTLPAELAMDTAERARAAGCRVIDHSSAFRADESVALITEGADAHLLRGDLVACPSAPAALLAPLFNALDELFTVAVAHVSLLSPVSALGNKGLRELAGQTGELLNARGIEPAVFPVQIAFNCIPLVGSSTALGENNNEAAFAVDMGRLLNNAFPVVLSVARIPVFYGQSAMISLQTEAAVDLGQARQALVSLGVIFTDSELDQGVATPVTDAAGQDGVYMSGLRKLPAPLQGLQFWVTADNVRQGAAKHSLFVLKNWIKDFSY
jgi:aspartate-semialdehyde dehydrogenase